MSEKFENEGMENQGGFLAEATLPYGTKRD